MISFAFTEEQEEFRRGLARFAQDELKPGYRERANRTDFPWDIQRRLGSMGVLGQTDPAIILSVATTFNVTNTATDTVDDNPGNGVCHDATGGCSLRAAVQESNYTGGSNAITVPGGTITSCLGFSSRLELCIWTPPMKSTTTINVA